MQKTGIISELKLVVDSHPNKEELLFHLNRIKESVQYRWLRKYPAGLIIEVIEDTINYYDIYESQAPLLPESWALKFTTRLRMVWQWREKNKENDLEALKRGERGVFGGDGKVI